MRCHTGYCDILSSLCSITDIMVKFQCHQIVTVKLSVDFTMQGQAGVFAEGKISSGDCKQRAKTGAPPAMDNPVEPHVVCFPSKKKPKLATVQSAALPPPPSTTLSHPPPPNPSLISLSAAPPLNNTSDETQPQCSRSPLRPLQRLD